MNPKIDMTRAWGIVESMEGSRYTHEQEAAKTMRALLQRVVELEEGVRLHRDQRGDDRCWLDDQQLYGLIDDGKKAEMALPPKEVFLKSCERYHASRQPPETLYSAQHCPGCTGHMTDLAFTALDRFEIAGRGEVFVTKVPVGQKFRLTDIVTITYKDHTAKFKILGIENIRQRCFDPETAEAVGLLVKAMVA